jgi:ribonuclease HII
MEDYHSMEDMLIYERAQWTHGIQHIAGIDEVGRGPVAGPVVAAAVVLPRGLRIGGVDDSKKISHKKRTELDIMIKGCAVAYGIGVADAETIDRVNILQATLLAMANAVRALGVAADAVLVDGTRAPVLPVYCQCLPHGDRLDQSVAAASILAKVYRDAWMRELHERYPQYGFDKHKGYGTLAHREAIKKYGLCPVHRKSFTVK